MAAGFPGAAGVGGDDVRELGIGDLARRSGVPVRTIRFYNDDGLPESTRSPGGHRRFPPDTVERLELIRRLRALGVGLSAIRQVLSGGRSLNEAIVREHAAVEEELRGLSWRRALLGAAAQAPPVGGMSQLALLAAVSDVRAAEGALTTFWRGLTTERASMQAQDAYLTMCAPVPPHPPTPRHAVAYAETLALIADPSLGRSLRLRARADELLIHKCLCHIPVLTVCWAPRQAAAPAQAA